MGLLNVLLYSGSLSRSGMLAWVLPRCSDHPVAFCLTRGWGNISKSLTLPDGVDMVVSCIGQAVIHASALKKPHLAESVRLGRANFIARGERNLFLGLQMTPNVKMLPTVCAPACL